MGGTTLTIRSCKKARLMHVPPRLLKVFKDERAATAIEYGLIVALIAIAIVGSLDALNGGITDMYNKVDTTVTQNLGNH